MSSNTLNAFQLMQNLHDDIKDVSSVPNVRFREWEASTVYVTNRHVSSTVLSDFYYKATVAGTTGGSEPTWPVVLGNTVVDGTVTWEAVSKDDQLGWPTLGELKNFSLPLVLTGPGTGAHQRIADYIQSTRELQILLFLYKAQPDNYPAFKNDVPVFIDRFSQVYGAETNKTVFDGDFYLTINNTQTGSITDTGSTAEEFYGKDFYFLQFQVQISFLE